jgi:hypothetical protein
VPFGGIVKTKGEVPTALQTVDLAPGDFENLFVYL